MAGEFGVAVKVSIREWQNQAHTSGQTSSGSSLFRRTAGRAQRADG
ncbi:hypothetical protein [Gluconobacter sp. OJB]